jgi:hypothetical protein
MKENQVHTTNYTSTFIAVAEDCPVTEGEVPPQKGGNKTAANIQFDMLIKHPYEYTSDDVLFQVYAEKNDIGAAAYKAQREQFFSKGQPCFRASPLTKRYGWGAHFNEEGKMAIYPLGSAEYKKLEQDKSLKVIKAVRSSRKQA